MNLSTLCGFLVLCRFGRQAFHPHPNPLPEERGPLIGIHACLHNFTYPCEPVKGEGARWVVFTSGSLSRVDCGRDARAPGTTSLVSLVSGLGHCAGEPELVSD